LIALGIKIDSMGATDRNPLNAAALEGWRLVHRASFHDFFMRTR
jgi:hypothetical protein